MFATEEEKDNSISKNIENYSKHVPDDYFQELKWERRKRTCGLNFIFKLLLGLSIGTLSCLIVFLFLNLNVTMWGLWQGVIGIFIGPLIAAMLLGLFFPCISHMSVCLGLLIGWAIPCYLMIGNYTSINVEQVTFNSNSKLSSKPEYAHTPLKNSTDPYNFVYKETLFVFFDRTTYKKVNESIKNQEASPQGDGDKSVRRRPRLKSSFGRNMLSTCYCYYGLVGMISCIMSSLLFAGVAGKCNCRLSTTSIEMLHPYVKKKCFIAVTAGEETTPSVLQGETDPRNRKKINAMKFIQETANI